MELEVSHTSIIFEVYEVILTKKTIKRAGGKPSIGSNKPIALWVKFCHAYAEHINSYSLVVLLGCIG